MKVAFKYPSHLKAKDRKTGFTGVITSRNVLLNGCVQYGIDPPAKDNKCENGWCIDEQDIVLVGKKKPSVYEHNFRFKPGERVRDLVSGLEGIAIRLILDSNNCERVCIEGPRNKEGKEQIDIVLVQRVKKIDDGLNLYPQPEKQVEAKPFVSPGARTGSSNAANSKSCR